MCAAYLSSNTAPRPLSGTVTVKPPEDELMAAPMLFPSSRAVCWRGDQPKTSTLICCHHAG